MTQILLKRQLKSLSCLLWNPKEKAEVSYLSELHFAILVTNNIINLFFFFFFHSTSGNNIYGVDVRETLQRLQKEGTDGNAAYILMQRIFPTVFPTFLMRDGICHKDHAISELGIYGAYLRYVSLQVMQWKFPQASPLPSQKKKKAYRNVLRGTCFCHLILYKCVLQNKFLTSIICNIPSNHYLLHICHTFLDCKVLIDLGWNVQEQGQGDHEWPVWFLDADKDIFIRWRWCRSRICSLR